MIFAHQIFSSSPSKVVRDQLSVAILKSRRETQKHTPHAKRAASQTMHSSTSVTHSVHLQPREIPNMQSVHEFGACVQLMARQAPMSRSHDIHPDIMRETESMRLNMMNQISKY